MKALRVPAVVLISACLMALAACGEEDAATTAGPSPAVSAAPSSADVTPSSAPSSPAAGGRSDKELCESAKKVGDDQKAALIAAMQSGEPSPADFKKILTEMSEQMATLASAGGDSDVATAMSSFGAQASKAAAAADPVGAADNAAFEKAGADITAACKAAGVSVNF
ncbi:hypothetical protein ABTX15_24235 [Micromonospora sp. NPDC094482]|uniref:hypothetical protein n=1 Tax=unclassified Micromonospora TaxID=2617518 RepID=UPI00331A8D17